MQKVATMRFIYDPRKSKLNNEKHGIDFEEAKALWDDPSVIEAPSNKCGEQTWAAIGRMSGSYWPAIYAKRDYAIRIISVRRATQKEISRYDKAYAEHERRRVR